MLLAEQLKKLGEDVLPIPRSAPDDAGLVVVDDHRHIFVAFLVAGLVNADVHEVVKPSGTLRLDVVQWTYLPTVFWLIRIYSETVLLSPPPDMRLRVLFVVTSASLKAERAVILIHAIH